VLTGGPCGGKTTGQARLSTFFENLGWKVYRVPETATVLLGGGVNFAELPEYAQFEFQVRKLKNVKKNSKRKLPLSLQHLTPKILPQNIEVFVPGESAEDNDTNRKCLFRLS